MNAEAVARGLGWFSIGLGLAEVAAAGSLARFLGLEDYAALVRLYGLRELGSGVGILSQPRPAGWVWGRVGGDILDLATLASGLRSDNPKRGRIIAVMATFTAVGVLDVLCARELSSGN